MWTMPRSVRSLVWLSLGILAGCHREETQDGVVVYTSLDDVFSRPLLEAFEKETGVHVKAVFDAEAVKTTGLYHRLLAERERPRADVYWSSEPARTVQLEKAGALAPYLSPSSKDIPAVFRAPSGAWTGFAARARVLVYNKNRVPEADRPRSIRDLAHERFRGEAAISDPLFGTMATHAGALRARLGAAGMEDLFRAFVSNGVKVLPGNSVVRDRVASGELRCGLTDTDDASVALARGMPIGVVFPDQDTPYPGLSGPLGTFVFPNTVALIAGGPRPDLGKRLIDFLLRPETEERLARSESAQIPVRQGLRGPELLRVPGNLIRMEVPFDEIARGVEESIELFRGLLVR